jgi:hypothetical protein
LQDNACAFSLRAFFQLLKKAFKNGTVYIHIVDVSSDALCQAWSLFKNTS